jgi:hypothetical protein
MHVLRHGFPFSFPFLQITEKKNELGKLESIDCGKPLEEALADLVISISLFLIGKTRCHTLFALT